MPTTRNSWLKAPAGLLVATAAAGAAIGVLAFLVARYGPAGSGWSFRGNGALAVYAAAPAVVAAGWSAVGRRLRARADWVVWSLAAGLVGVALAVIDAALLPIFGTGADRTAGPIVLLALAAWTLAAPALAMALAGRSSGRAPISVAAAAGEALAVVVGLAAGLAVTSLAMPPGS